MTENVADTFQYFTESIFRTSLHAFNSRILVQHDTTSQILLRPPVRLFHQFQLPALEDNTTPQNPVIPVLPIKPVTTAPQPTFLFRLPAQLLLI